MTTLHTWATADPEYRHHRTADEDRIRSGWDRYADGWSAAYLADALRPPETDTDPEPRDHFRRGDADLGCGLMVIIAAACGVAVLALLAWIAGRGR